MGYTTVFKGDFKLDRKLDDETYNLLVGLANTRRMKRNIEGYGVEGEFYIEGKGFMGQDYDETVVDGNNPPSTQPSLWLQWIPTDDKMAIVWDGAEKFYRSEEWIDYIIKSILKPRGYLLNGCVNAEGEDGNRYHIIVNDNMMMTDSGYSELAGEPNWKDL